MKSLMKLIRVQSRVRGFLQRRKFGILKLKKGQGEGNSYFPAEEAKETIGLYEDDGYLVERTHRYKTGAVYAGEWKGGMRHGRGTIEWADRVFYAGDW